MAGRKQGAADRLLERRAEQVLAMHGNGRSVYFIADYMGLRPAAVRRFLRGRGIDLGAKGRGDGSRGANQHAIGRIKPPKARFPEAREVAAWLRRWPRVA